MKNIKTIRMNAGMSQQTFANLFGVHQTAVSQWEKGRTSPDIETAKAIADYFHVDLDYILDRESPESADKPEDRFLIALSAEAKTLTDEQKQDVIDFIRFKKSQNKK